MFCFFSSFPSSLDMPRFLSEKSKVKNLKCSIDIYLSTLDDTDIINLYVISVDELKLTVNDAPIRTYKLTRQPTRFTVSKTILKPSCFARQPGSFIHIRLLSSTPWPTRNYITAFTPPARHINDPPHYHP